MLNIFKDELAIKKIQKKQEMFAELTKKKEAQNIKMEIVRDFIK